MDEGLLNGQRDEDSYKECRVLSGVPQRSILAPIMYVVYINDMVEGANSYIILFADDVKLA